MAELEKDIERALGRMVKRRGGLCLKWVCPGWSGVPDRIVLLPGGRIIFVELKRRGGRVSPMQSWWKTTLFKLGFRHIYIWTKTDIDILEGELELLGVAK